MKGFVVFQTFPYALQARFRLRIAIFHFLVASFLPPIMGIPIPSTAYLIGLAFFYTTRAERTNEFGLWPEISPQVWKVIQTILLLGGMWLFVLTIYHGITHMYAGISSAATNHTPDRIPTILSEAMSLNQDYFDAIANKDLFAALSYGWRYFVTVALIAPFTETIMFYGLLFPPLFRRFGYRVALTIVVSVFLALHLPQLIIMTLANGFTWVVFGEFVLMICGFYFMGFLYAKTHSLYPSIALHAVYNFLDTVTAIILHWGIPGATVIITGWR